MISKNYTKFGENKLCLKMHFSIYNLKRKVELSWLTNF